MLSNLLLITTLVFLVGGVILEYRNPLWRLFLKSASPLPETSEGASSDEMVFFWVAAETYAKSVESDYWNAMDVVATPSGLLIKRPFFMFGRRSAFFPWQTLIAGETFYTWLAKRRAMRLTGTELYFSISERCYKNHVQHHVSSAK